jgi:hypothetical protein
MRQVLRDDIALRLVFRAQLVLLGQVSLHLDLLPRDSALRFAQSIGESRRPKPSAFGLID